MTQQQPSVTLTAPMLKAMANPLRRRIFDTLSAMESGRASDIGKLLNVASNTISFHLRELSKAQLITEAPELARDKRDRVWKLVGQGYTTGEADRSADAESGSAMMAYLQQVTFDEQQRLGAALRHAAAYYSTGAAATPRAHLNTSNLMLTEQEAEVLRGRMEQMMADFREDAKNGKLEIENSEPDAGKRALWHFSGLLMAEELLDGADLSPDSTQNQ